MKMEMLMTLMPTQMATTKRYIHWKLRVTGTLVLTTIMLPIVHAVVNFPGVEFNAAMGQVAHASSYYDYSPNAVFDTAYVAQNAIDGFVGESSWWSSGEESTATGAAATIAAKPFWQLNMTSTPPSLKRIVIRWHGFLTPSTYRIRVSYMGENFQTIGVVQSQPVTYDRVDTITEGLASVDPRFQFLRVLMDEANVCQDEYSCAADAAVASTTEPVIYGIREFELWATGSKNSAPRTSEGDSIYYSISVLVAMAMMPTK